MIYCGLIPYVLPRHQPGNRLGLFLPYSYVFPEAVQHGCNVPSSQSPALDEVMVKLLHHIFTCLGITNGLGLFFPNWISERNDYMGEAVKNLKPVPVEQMAILKTVAFPSYTLLWVVGAVQAQVLPLTSFDSLARKGQLSERPFQF